MSAARITLREVAKAAGVSVAAVSHALRNDRNASRETCARVQRIARELGYVPNPLLAQLASRRFSVAGVMARTPLVFATHASNPASGTYWRYLDELKELSAERGYLIRHEPIGSAEFLRQAVRRWYHRGVRGVIFGMFEATEWLEGIDLAPFSVVILGGRCRRTLFNTVKADVVIGTKRVLDEMATRVPGRLGVVLHRHASELKDDLLREGVARTWMDRLSVRRRTPILIQGFEVPVEEQQRRLVRWLREHQPDCVCGFTVLKWYLERSGFFRCNRRRFIALIQTPRELTLGLMGSVEPVRREAGRAITLIDGMIRHGETGMPDDPVEILVPPGWVDGDVSSQAGDRIAGSAAEKKPGPARAGQG